ncbi:unnamed protein product, partial [Adineta steineri]
FIIDLNQQLKQEHQLFSKQQKNSIINLYRGQFIHKDELNRLKTTIGELISMNSFLSTTKNKIKALEFIKNRSSPNEQLISILLEINVNIKSQTSPLADIKHLSVSSQEEEEILFMFGAIFRIDDVSFDEELKIWKTKLTLCSEG